MGKVTIEIDVEAPQEQWDALYRKLEAVGMGEMTAHEAVGLPEPLMPPPMPPGSILAEYMARVMGQGEE